MVEYFIPPWRSDTQYIFHHCGNLVFLYCLIFVYLNLPATKTCLCHLEIHTRREIRASNFKITQRC